MERQSRDRSDSNSILIFIDWFRPAYKAGGPIRSIENLLPIIGENFKIYIITGDRDLGEKDPLTDIELNRWKDFSENTRVIYLTKGLQTFSNLKDLIYEINPKYIYLNGVFSLRFTLLPLAISLFSNIQSKIVLAPRGMLQRGALRKGYIKKILYLKAFATLTRRANTVFHATDETEINDISSVFHVNEGRIIQASNVPVKPMTDLIVANLIRPLRMLFFSRLTSKKNLHGLLRALEEFQPHVELTVAGDFESAAYEKKCLSIAEQLSNVCFIGSYKPNEIRDLVLQSHLVVLPSYGENFGHSIYEAMACGRPLIIGNNTPWSEACKECGYVIDANSNLELKAAIDSSVHWQQESYNVLCGNALMRAQEFYQNTDFRSEYQRLFPL